MKSVTLSGPNDTETAGGEANDTAGGEASRMNQGNAAAPLNSIFLKAFQC